MLKNKSPASKPLQAARPLLTTVATLVLTLAAATSLHAQSGPLEDLAKFPRTTVAVLNGKSMKGAHQFDVWIANTPARQEQGFMFVQDVPLGQGMLFPVTKPRKMNMWMKDTYVELDILFVGEKGAVDQIIEHAKPLDLTKLISNKPLTAVLELKGGQVASLGLKVGDRVNWEPPPGCDCSPPPPPKPTKDSH